MGGLRPVRRRFSGSPDSHRKAVDLLSVSACMARWPSSVVVEVTVGSPSLGKPPDKRDSTPRASLG
jgi:hypothetical protein